LKEGIFTYLLQKREDTELALVMATPNAKVIDPAAYSSVPVAPQKMKILLAALLVGIIIPVIIIYIRELFDTKIHTKEDITRIISAPFLGVVPITKGEDPFPVLKVRSSIAERFRTIISNLEFIVGSERKKIIAVTSYTSGDGKSFFSRNLAMSLATSGKKTLLVDLDLRKSTLKKTLGMEKVEKGSAMFLSDPRISVNEIIDKSHAFHKNLDIIPVHIFPPNPAELLSSDRMELLFQTIGKEYDYIIVDTAPVGLVSDIYNINAFSLATIFLMRSDYSLKRTLPEIQEMYNEKRLNNLCITLNSVSDENIYGYGYGHYGAYKHNYYTDEK
jgi:capsular exopolysaccharide synthesis family protein